MGGKLPPYAVAESDGNPTVYQPFKIIFPNGTITDVGDGTVYVGIGTSIETTTSITVSSYDVRTPVLVAGTILYFLTNGTVTQFLNGAGTYSVPSSLAYAPSGSTFIIQTNDAILPNAQILAALSTGLLKNTAVTGVLTVASGGVDFENLLTAGSPILRIGNVIHADTASATKNGFLLLADFNKFTAKADTSTTITVLSPLSGGGNFSANITIGFTTDGNTTTYLRGDGTYKSVYEARTPLLSAGTVLSILTDGSTTNFMRGDGTLAVPSSNSGIKIILFTVYSDDTWTGDAVPIGQAPFETPITIKQVNVTSNGASPLLGFNLEMRPWGSMGVTGSNIFSAIQSAPTTGIEITTAISSATIPAKAHIFFASSAIISGQADYITGSIYYSRDSI